MRRGTLSLAVWILGALVSIPEGTAASAATVAGTVLALNDATPLPSVVVQAVRADLRAEAVTACLTDPAGRYRLEGLAPGRYRLRCQVPGGFVEYRDGAPLEVVGEKSVPDRDFRLAPFKKGVWRYWEGSDQQPMNLIVTLLEDPREGLWMGGLDGICRFDGRNLVTYRQADGLDDVAAVVFTRGPGGSLWVGTEQSMYEYDSRSEASGGRAFRRLPEPLGRSGVAVDSWWQDLDGTVWFGTPLEGIWRIDPGQAPRQIDAAVSDVASLARHAELGIVVATLGGPRHWNGTRFAPLPGIPRELASTRIVSVKVTRNGTLWLCAWPGGLWSYDQGRYRRFTASDGQPSDQVITVTEDPSGVLWIGFQDGIARFDGTSFVHFRPGQDLPSGLSRSQDPLVATLGVARDGALWVNLPSSGLLRYEEDAFVTFTTADGLHTNRLAQALATSDGSVWLAGADSLFYASPDLTRWDGRRMRVWTKADGLPEAPVWGLATNRQEELFLATRHGLVRRTNTGFTRPIIHEEAWTGTWAIRVAPASDGGLWVGAEDGRVSHFDGERFSTRFRASSNMVARGYHAHITAVLEDSRGRVWFGGAGRFLGYYDGKEVHDLSFPEGTGVNTVFGIAEGPDGHVWIGTAEGLFRFDGRTLVRLPSHGDMTVPGAVLAVFRDRDGVLWFGSSHGVRCYDGATWTALETADGLAGNQVMAIQQDARGDYWFATTSGLTRYRPRRRDLAAPEVALRLPGGSVRRARPDTVQRGQSVSFRLRAVDFATLPAKRHYRLAFVPGARGPAPDRQDPRWQSFLGVDEVPWSASAAGDMTLWVQCVDRDRNYSPCTRLVFAVLLPWHENPWILAPGGAGILGLLGVSVWSSTRHRHRRREAIALQGRLLAQEHAAREAAEQAGAMLQRWNTELDEARRAAETANRVKSLFLANMSHEIRTPLNAILGYAQVLLRGGDLPDRQRRAVETIDLSGQHLLGMINDVLDLSKIEAGHTVLQPVDFHLRLFLEGLVEMFRPRCVEKGLQLECIGPPDAASGVRGDEGKLRHVLVNLLGNAVKFTDHGSVTLVASAPLPPTSPPAVFRFEVRDTGRGIEPEALSRVFRPFEQGAEGLRQGGWGLGLALAQRYVELMGGRLTATSQPGRGSSFVVELPLAWTPGSPAAHRPRTDQAILGLAPGCRVTALVVDDNPQNREVLAEMLGGLGCAVRLASDGPEALERAREHPPDIVFLDIRMPGMDGFEVARRLRAAAVTGSPGPPLVAVSASALAHERQRCAASDFDAFLAKPFRFEELCDCLVRLLRVEFRYGMAAPRAASPDEAPTFGHLAMPEELRERIRLAADRYSATHLAEALADLEHLGTDQARAVGLLRRWLSAGRFDAIAGAVAPDREVLPSPSPSPAIAGANHDTATPP